MRKWGYNYTHYCRWDNRPYTSKKPHPQSGFCCNACKMAHYRAYKRYVTQKSADQKKAVSKRVTHKKGK